MLSPRLVTSYIIHGCNFGSPVAFSFAVNRERRQFCWNRRSAQGPPLSAAHRRSGLLGWIICLRPRVRHMAVKSEIKVEGEYIYLNGYRRVV